MKQAAVADQREALTVGNSQPVFSFSDMTRAVNIHPVLLPKPHKPTPQFQWGMGGTRNLRESTRVKWFYFRRAVCFRIARALRPRRRIGPRLASLPLAHAQIMRGVLRDMVAPKGL